MNEEMTQVKISFFSSFCSRDDSSSKRQPNKTNNNDHVTIVMHCGYVDFYIVFVRKEPRGNQILES